MNIKARFNRPPHLQPLFCTNGFYADHGGDTSPYAYYCHTSPDHPTDNTPCGNVVDASCLRTRARTLILRLSDSLITCEWSFWSLTY